MKTTDKRLKDVDAAYTAALKDYNEARKRLRVAGVARIEAHRQVEWERSAEAQRAANMTDDEYKALLQRMETARGPKLEPNVNAPGAG